MTVSIQDSGLAPGEGFRFAVGSVDGPKSTIYRIWTQKNKPDLFLAGIPTAGVMKVSFHESGQWQHSFLSQVAMEYVSTNAERHVDKWQRPAPLTPGWTQCYCITVPRTELRYTNVDVADVRWAGDPGHGYWITLHIVLRDPEITSTLAWDDGLLLGNLLLANGGSATVLAQRFRPKQELAQKIAKYRDFLLGSEEIQSQMRGMDAPVVGLYGASEAGVRGVTELSMGIPPPEVRVICTGMDFLDPLHIEITPLRRRS